MSDSESDVPSDIEEAAQSALSTIIPKKSKSKYDLAYVKFSSWCEQKRITHLNEKVLLAYFQEKKEMKSSTLWSLYSMLRTELSLKRNIDIKKYTNLLAFLKRHSEGYQPKKSQVLSKENIANFLREAADVQHLMNKVGVLKPLFSCCYRYIFLYNSLICF